MCQEMLFFNLATAISGMPTPEVCFLPGQLRWTLLPKERNSDSLSGCGSPNLPIEADTLLLSYRRPREIFVANAQVSGNVVMCSWGSNDRSKKIKLVLIIYRNFMQSLFYQIFRGGAI